MSTKITGKIRSITAITTHNEPSAEMYIGEIDSNGQVTVNLTFANTGNVPQTVTMAEPTDLVNCSFLGGHFVIGAGETEFPNIATLLPGQDCIYKLNLQVNEIPVGSPSVDFELNVDWTWS